MEYNHELRFRVTKEQREKILLAAKQKGFQAPSQYIRWFLLNKATETEEKINLIYNILKENGSKK